jgi:hypothetical protein
MTNLEKMGDQDLADVRRFYYMYVVYFGRLQLFTCLTNLVEILVECFTFSLLWMLKEPVLIKMYQ